MNKSKLKQQLSDWHIEFEVVKHEPLFDCQQADNIELLRPGVRTKNLFLRDNYGRVHLLLVTAPNAQVDLKQLSKKLALSRIGFASKQRLKAHLAVEPGHVSILALINDRHHKVQLYMDEALWHGEPLHCHPLQNDETLLLTPTAINRFLQHTGHAISLINLPHLTNE